MKRIDTFAAIGAQSASPPLREPAAGPEFEAASVKVDRSVGPSLLISVPEQGKLEGRRVSLMRLIGFAYDLSYPLISGPSWLDSTEFEIQAKGQAESKNVDTRLKLMTQALLAQRFGLQFHRETKEANVYFLVVAGGGLKMVPADGPRPPGHKPPLTPQLTTVGNFSMRDLAASLSKQIQAPVIDRTGTEGKFFCYLVWGRNPDTDPDIFQAVQEQLGLKLQAGKSDVEVLAIDRVSRTPSEN
jgi:uncharacterized protein (TIGR03435 family)